jgi:hypothetical protein
MTRAWLGSTTCAATRYIEPTHPDAKPRFLWMDTPGNKACLAQVARIQLDPDKPEDALKVDADSAGAAATTCTTRRGTG